MTQSHFAGLTGTQDASTAGAPKAEEPPSTIRNQTKKPSGRSVRKPRGDDGFAPFGVGADEEREKKGDIVAEFAERSS